jgi:SAM-dependent methyltransferase
VEYPLPPAELVTRVGTVEGADPYDFYLREGAAVRARIEALLPADWSWAGKRALDFGCGSGRVLRHFLDLDLDPAPELWGCDIDPGSIEWLDEHLSPPLHPFGNDLMPPLKVADDFFDLVWATSVFTHIDRWSEWLLEMHRVLVPGGWLIASWLGEGIWEAMVGEPYRPEEVGITVLRHWQVGGAWVFHSEWWLREHWGRAFDVMAIVPPPRHPDGSPQVTHSYVALRQRPGSFTAEQLQRPSADDPRELAGMQTHLRLLRAETDGLLDGTIEGPAPLAQSGPGRLLRQAVRRSPLADPLRTVRRELRARRR